MTIGPGYLLLAVAGRGSLIGKRICGVSGLTTAYGILRLNGLFKTRSRPDRA